jgi:hypothetical protein
MATGVLASGDVIIASPTPAKPARPRKTCHESLVRVGERTAKLR